MVNGFSEMEKKRWLKMMDTTLGTAAVYRMRLNKFSVSLFLHNQNLLSHEGTHHMYMKDFINALDDKEREYEKVANLKKWIQGLYGGTENGQD